MKIEQTKMNINSDDNLLVVQSNSLAMANYDMTSMEQKLFLIMLSTIKKDDTELKPVVFKVTELAEIMGVSSENLYRDLIKICKSLMSKVVEVKVGENDLDMFNIIPYAKYKQKKGEIELPLNDKAKPYLLELKKILF